MVFRFSVGAWLRVVAALVALIIAGGFLIHSE